MLWQNISNTIMPLLCYNIGRGSDEMPQIMPIKELRNTTKISELCRQSNEPVFITKNGYGDMVVMSMKTYEEKMAVVDIHQKLAQAEEDIQGGRTNPAQEAFAKLRANHGL
jgi:PHD/YefM family antitoxin component YafN of YafNO toxin-antitoxin module